MALRERLWAAQGRYVLAAEQRAQLEVSNLSPVPNPELQEARLGESRAWAQREAARRDLVARLSPRRAPARRWASRVARRWRVVLKGQSL